MVIRWIGLCLLCRHNFGNNVHIRTWGIARNNVYTCGKTWVGGTHKSIHTMHNVMVYCCRAIYIHRPCYVSRPITLVVGEIHVKRWSANEAANSPNHSYYKVHLLLQGMHPITKCTSYYKVCTLLQSVPPITRYAPYYKVHP